MGLCVLGPYAPPSSCIEFTALSPPQFPPTAVRMEFGLDNLNAPDAGGTVVHDIDSSDRESETPRTQTGTNKKIPRPHGEPGRPSSGGFDLVDELAKTGWSKRSAEELTAAVHFLAQERLDVMKCYRKQDKKEVKRICNEDPSTFGEAQDLFKRFLTESPEIPLWQLYLTYVRYVFFHICLSYQLGYRRINTQWEPVRKAYEFAIHYVGQDRDSGTIWMDYIHFLRLPPTTEEKLHALRRVYYRAVQVPFNGVEKLWQELKLFEDSLDITKAREVIENLWPVYIRALRTFRQLSNHTGALIPTPAPTPLERPELVLPALPILDAAERCLLARWKAYLKWEESDPLELDKRDQSATLVSRIRHVYRKALIRMWYHDEIRSMACVWLAKVGQHEEALKISEMSVKANPDRVLMDVDALETEVHCRFNALSLDDRTLRQDHRFSLSDDTMRHNPCLQRGP
ncbi:hypothetical protein C0992_005078 [Termitomyces sp. T32_za158]|nr:hypothetical protein C0992_005078 [Termitomyces sp. T32_za158]